MVSRIEERVLDGLAGERPLPTHWLHGDDKCACPHQRIGEWTNPYIAQTLQIRLCCIWAELAKMFPQFVQAVPAFYDDNRDEWVRAIAPWDSEEMDMPLYLWYRQVAAQTGRTLEDVRQEYSKKKHLRPKALPKGRGKESRPPPDAARVAAAHKSGLRQSGWFG